jgi:tetratricopeptide (TPR) repeat protein
LSQTEGKHAEAVAHFNKVIEIDPKQDIGYRNLAIVYRRSNELDKEEETIKRALAAMPERPILSIGQASIYERQGNFDKAIETYEALLKIDSGVLVAKNNLASLLTDHRQDQASFDKARSISAELRSSPIPQFRDTYAWVSVKSDTNLEEAVVILEGIVKDNEQVDIYHYHLGEAYRKKGDSEKAMAYLNKAIELSDPESNPESDIAEKAKESLRQLQ